MCWKCEGENEDSLDSWYVFKQEELTVCFAYGSFLDFQLPSHGNVSSNTLANAAIIKKNEDLQAQLDLAVSKI